MWVTSEPIFFSAADNGNIRLRLRVDEGERASHSDHKLPRHGTIENLDELLNNKFVEWRFGHFFDDDPPQQFDLLRNDTELSHAMVIVHRQPVDPLPDGWKI